MTDMNYDGMGRFIYGAARFGGDLTDVTDWMADDLRMARPLPDDDDARRDLYLAFFAKYADRDALRENFDRFMTLLKNRPSSPDRVREKTIPRRIDNPKFIASESILWLKPDGTETMIEAKIGEPYQIDARSWACPASLEGVDGRYPDRISINSLQALTLALRLVETRLSHLLEDNAQLVHPDDRSPWYLSSLTAPSPSEKRPET